MSAIIAIGSLSVDFYLIDKTKTTLVSEKQQKLFALAQLMDNSLSGTFNEILAQEGLATASRAEKIVALNRRLGPITDQIASAQSGIGIGYYSKDLDAIITYGPSRLLGQKVGLAIDLEHQGRQVMADGKPRVQMGDLVRGSIMNCMIPLIRDQKIIGYIWANELLDGINQQIHKLSSRSYLIITFGILFSFIGTAFIAMIVGSRIREITAAIKNIETDANYRIPPMAGDLGLIAKSINEFAERLILRRRMEAQIQQTDRLVALGEVAAGIAHEIRNPLTTIKGFVQLIEKDMDEGHPNRKFTKIIISETDRLNKMVHELLYYAKPSDSLKTDINIGRILDDTLQLVKLNKDYQQIEIERFLLEKQPQIKGDPEQLKQVFLNLLLNSMQAVGANGHLIIRSTLKNQRLLVSIEDNGKGIQPQHLARLFDPFFTTRSDGTGLGLAVAQKIVALHQGEIIAENKDGGGARFTVTLPTYTET
jgi:two-component system sensor histidine kinase HydH